MGEYCPVPEPTREDGCVSQGEIRHYPVTEPLSGQEGGYSIIGKARAGHGRDVFRGPRDKAVRFEG